MSKALFPLQGNYTITSKYGSRSAPTNGASTIHKGIDIAAAAGSNVLSVLSGTVKDTGYNSSRGNYVIIDHGNGYTTLYQHLKNITASKGQTVGQGYIIGSVGSTGVSTGPHLHFEVTKNNNNIDPEMFLKADLNQNTTTMNNQHLFKTISDNWLMVGAALIIIAILTK